MILVLGMAKANPISWEEIASGYMSGVFETKAVWYDTTYREILGAGNNNVILVFLGRRPSGGYGIKVESVKTDRKKIYIVAKETCPKPGSMVIAVITSPFVAIKVDLEDKLPIKLEVKSCKQ